jgi:hypothetical protein
MDEMEWLEKWYQSNCDGDWEHGYGVKITTIDNPGWSVEINLRKTQVNRLQHDRLELDKGEGDWIQCWIDDETFKGYGDALKLKMVIAVFRDWVETAGTHP